MSFYRIIKHRKYGNVLVRKDSFDEVPCVSLQLELTEGLTVNTDVSFTSVEARDKAFGAVTEEAIDKIFQKTLEEFESIEEYTQ